MRKTMVRQMEHQDREHLEVLDRAQMAHRGRERTVRLYPQVHRDLQANLMEQMNRQQRRQQHLLMVMERLGIR